VRPSSETTRKSLNWRAVWRRLPGGRGDEEHSRPQFRSAEFVIRVAPVADADNLSDRRYEMVGGPGFEPGASRSRNLGGLVHRDLRHAGRGCLVRGPRAGVQPLPVDLVVTIQEDDASGWPRRVHCHRTAGVGGEVHGEVPVELLDHGPVGLGEITYVLLVDRPGDMYCH